MFGTLHATAKSPNKSPISPETPTMEFDMKDLKWSKAQDVIKAARSASDPGPSGVPYSVYRRCPKLLHQLWKILRVMWGLGELANQRRYGSPVVGPNQHLMGLHHINWLKFPFKDAMSPESHRPNPGLLQQLPDEVHFGVGVSWLEKGIITSCTNSSLSLPCL